MSSHKLRWGILSTANIARKNWQAIQNSGNATVVAVASRDVARSARFIAECQAQAPMAQVPVALGSYEELLLRRDIDAVYIPLPTGLRKEWVLKAAAAGKHVVCEKPCAVSIADLREMVEACRQHRVQFMDGVMFMHSRRLDQLRSVLDGPEGIGAIQRINTVFSFCAPPEFFTGNIRAHQSLEPQGCLGDLGWYCLRFALWAMGERMPREVSGRLLHQVNSPGGGGSIPTEFTGEVYFEGGVSSGFYCSFLTNNQQSADILGPLGGLHLTDFVLPFFGDTAGFVRSQAAFQVNGCTFNMEPHRTRFSVPEYSNNHPTAQETNLFRNFSKQVQSGTLNSEWADRAIKTQTLLDACLESARDNGRRIRVG